MSTPHSTPRPGPQATPQATPHSLGDTPEALLRAFVENADPEAAGRLFDATAPALFRLALTLAHDAAAAEDALQDTFLAALEHAARFDDGRPVMPWLSGILRRKIGRQRRDAARTPDVARLAAATPPDGPLALAASAEERERVHAAIDALPEPYRGVALLRWRYGLGPAEIAHARGEPPGTVRSLLHRAARKLEAGLGMLPAVMVVAGGRGLRAMRARVVEAATHLRPAPRTAKPPVPAATAAALLTGGLLMGTAQKAMIVAGVLVLALIAGIAVTSSTTRDAAQRPTPPADPAPNVDAARERRRVHVDERTPGAADARAASGRALPPPVDLASADRDRDVHGRVTDAAGEPIAGAALTLLAYPWRRVSVLNHEDYRTAETVADALTAEDGTFSLRLRRGDLVDVRVEAVGYVTRTIGDVQAGERLAIELLPETGGGVALTVLVLDVDDAPVENATVRVFTLASQPDVSVDLRETTDATGRATFGSLPPSTPLQADVDAAGLGNPSWVPFELPAAGPHQQTIRLPRGRTIAGTVTDAATGLPIAGALIGMNWVQNKAVRSGAGGAYELTGWSGKGTREITVTAEGYGRQDAEVGDRTTIDFALERGDSVVGRLVGPGGDAVAGAQVSAIASEHDGRVQTTSYAHGISDAEGRFHLSSLRHDMAHTLVVTARGLGRTLYDIDPHPGVAGTIDLSDVSIHAALSIEGVVRDADGVAIPHLGVTLSGANADRARRRGRKEPLPFHYGASERRRTDDLGRFRFPDLAPGSYTIAAEPRGAPQRSTLVQLTTADVLDVVVGMARGRRITVTVLDPDDAPLAGVYVSAVGGGGQGVGGRTDADGTCELTLEAAQQAQVYAFGGEALPADLVQPPTQIVAPDQSTLTFRFLRGHVVKGRVLDPGGDAVVGVQVEMRSGETMRSLATTDDAGRFETRVGGREPLDVLVRGNVQRREGGTIKFERLPWRGQARGVVPGGPEITIRCHEIASDRTITIRVTDPDGAPLAGMYVWSFNAGTPPPRGETDDAGIVVLEGLLAEECMFMVNVVGEPRPEWLAPAALRETPAGQTIEMRFRRAAQITGTVLGRDGEPVSGAGVTARLPGGSTFSATTDADGHFALPVPADEPAFALTASWVDSTTGRTTVKRKAVPPDTDVTLQAK